MFRSISFGDGKSLSFVYTFTGQLLRDEDRNAPTPDFLKFLHKWLWVEVGTTDCEAANKKWPKEEREALKLFHDAMLATGRLLDFYLKDSPVFKKVAAHLMFLPCLLSRHPDNQRFNRAILKDSRLAQHLPRGKHFARQSWPVRYAYAIIETIALTLEHCENRLPQLAETYGYGRKHPVSFNRYLDKMNQMGWPGWDENAKQQHLLRLEGCYRILPSWTKGIEKLPRPFNAENVQDYWQKGKEMILEEMPEFHLRPEWRNYCERRYYNDGPKKGATQHAIFKDILTALKTIAVSSKQRKVSKTAVK